MAVLSETISIDGGIIAPMTESPTGAVAGVEEEYTQRIHYLNKGEKQAWVTERKIFNLNSVYWNLGRFGPQWTLTVTLADPIDPTVYGISLSFNRGRNAQMTRLSEALRRGFAGPFMLTQIELEDDKRTYSVQPV